MGSNLTSYTLSRNISNDMQKSRNGFLVQKLWPAEVQGFEALGRKQYWHIGDRRSNVSEIERSEVSVSGIGD